MDILKLLNINHKCSHSKISPESELSYCPDCGELIENRWFITRCAFCGVKVKAMIKNGEVIAQEKFCHNCGSNNFVPEQISKINCIDINYAVLVKTVVVPQYDEYSNNWTDVKTGSKIKLLSQT